MITHLAFWPASSSTSFIPFSPWFLELLKVHVCDTSISLTDLTRNLDELASECRLLVEMNDGCILYWWCRTESLELILKAATLETLALKEQIEKAWHGQQEFEEHLLFHSCCQRDKKAACAHSPLSEVSHRLLSHRSGCSGPSPTPCAATSPNKINPRTLQGHNNPPNSTTILTHHDQQHPLTTIIKQHLAFLSSFTP